MVYAKTTKLAKEHSKMPKKKFVSTHIDKHHKMLCGVRERLDKRMAVVAQRNEILKATETYNARIERDRIVAHIHDRPASFQKQAAMAHVGELTRRIHKLAGQRLAIDK